MKIKNIEAEVDIKIPFHDVDSIGIVWHGHYTKYFEIARSALLAKYNYDVDQMIESGYGWPVIELKARYINALKYNMEIRIKAQLVELEHSLMVSYLIFDKETGKKYCKGHTVQVAIDMEEKEMQLESPNIIFERFGLKRD